jgi:hypothetical protein
MSDPESHYYRINRSTLHRICCEFGALLTYPIFKVTSPQQNKHRNFCIEVAVELLKRVQLFKTGLQTRNLSRPSIRSDSV